MTPDELFSEFEAGFEHRRFSAGLLVSLIDLLSELGVPDPAIGSYDELLSKYPRQTHNSKGRQVNQFSLTRLNGKTIGTRPFYNKIADFYRAEHHRFDYPSAAPHATQAWPDYIHWINALVTFDATQLAELRGRVNDYVLATLPSQAFDPSSVVVEPPLFRLLLESFEMTAQKGEPTGASFQGIVFGFLRADNPHLQVEIDKVRTGGARKQRVGDVDGWEGQRLAISAEVKQYELGAKAVTDLAAFANKTGQRGSLGVVAALGFQAGVREELEKLGLKTLDRTDMVRIVELWDPIKQRTAVASFVYYASHVERNSSLAGRLAEFLKDTAEKWEADRASAAAEDDPPADGD